MPLTAVLAAVDVLVAVWLLWRAPRQQANKAAVVAVAAALLAIGGWLAALALPDEPSRQPTVTPRGPLA